MQGQTQYDRVFNTHIIPTQRELPGHHFYDAENINVVSKTDCIEPELLVIDSSGRNWDKEESNNYRLFLGQKFQYVHSIELVDGFVPASGYIINQTNNQLHFCEHHKVIEIQIPHGNYGINDLTQQIGLLMNDASPHHYTYSCTVDKITRKVIFTCDHDFELIFGDGSEVVGERGLVETLTIDPKSGRKELKRVETAEKRHRYIQHSIGLLLGFKPINLEGSDHYTGQMIYELVPNKYLAIYVNTENSEDFKKITAPSINNGADGAFALVPLDRNGDHFSITRYNQVVDNSRYIKTFNPPIQFNQLRIRFQTVDGQLYDFNGLDHYLVFEIKRTFGHEVIRNLKNLT
jgi:hypothetical protein